MKRLLTIDMYKRMVLIRRFEEKVQYLFSTRAMPGSIHQYIGQEAVAVGACIQLMKDDYITSTHRGHGHCIAKGMDINAIMAEIYAKKTGCCRGMGGSMHISDLSMGIIGANGIVGGGIPIATGAAWSCKYKKEKKIVMCFFGEGAVNQGSFHESLNLAAIWKLPVIYVCENNIYGYTTHYKRTTLLDDIAQKGLAYGIPGIVADGMDVLDVYRKTGEMIKRARDGDGASIIECKTYRYRGHSINDKSTYRKKEEVEKWKKNDPLNNFKSYLVKQYDVTSFEIEEIQKEVDKQINDAIQFAENSPETDPMDFKKYIFA